MSWKPVIVGVDASPEAVPAAAFAWDIARRAHTSCHLVHATHDTWAAVTSADMSVRLGELDDYLIEQARAQVAQSLNLHVPRELVAQLSVVNGRAPLAINDAVVQHQGGLIVLGGKHHSRLGRWLGGSTGHDMVRAASVPVLITSGAPGKIERVLVAVDLSPAAKATIALAERFAALFGARLRAISVLEPVPLVPEAPPVDLGQFYALWEDMLRRDVWPALRTPGVETVVRHGTAVDTLLREAHDWPADVLVVGSHGKNLAQRVLLGSVTERLLHHLPTTLLVEPIGAQVAEARERAREDTAAAIA